MNKIDQFLKDALSKSSSDLHFISGDPPRVRIHGSLTTLNDESLSVDFVREAIYEIMSGQQQRDFEKDDAADFAYEIPGLSRFRVNVMRHLNGYGAVMRAIPSKALTLEELNMPTVVHNLCKQTQGMILVTGKTGSGKSTTLAAMIDAINKRIKGHILTIEDPIEFVHVSKGCLISQREVGVHSDSFADALHSALREDPDVILVGELRDLETISIAVTAAEMGILVMGTLHTNGAGQTVDRMVNTFPADKQNHIRTMLSTSLRGVIATEKRAWAHRGPGDPRQHFRCRQPDPPGENRSAGDGNAKRRRDRHEDHGQRIDGSRRKRQNLRAGGLPAGGQQGKIQGAQRRTCRADAGRRKHHLAGQLKATQTSLTWHNSCAF
jgi:twitching motility protein PilT